MTNFNITIPEPTLNPYSSRQYNADVYCACCGRGIGNRETATVVKLISRDRSTGETVFAPIEWDKVKGRDSVEWGTFVGSHCQKQLPKEFKVSQKRVRNAWVKNGCP